MKLGTRLNAASLPFSICSYHQYHRICIALHQFPPIRRRFGTISPILETEFEDTQTSIPEKHTKGEGIVQRRHVPAGSIKTSLPIQLRPPGSRENEPFYLIKHNPWREIYNTIDVNDANFVVDCGEFFCMLRLASQINTSNSSYWLHFLRWWPTKFQGSDDTSEESLFKTSSVSDTHSGNRKYEELLSHHRSTAWAHLSCLKVINELRDGRHRELVYTDKTPSWKSDYLKLCKSLVLKGYHTHNPALALNAYIGAVAVKGLISRNIRLKLWQRFASDHELLKRSVYSAMTFYDTLYQNFSKSTHLGEPKNRIARLGLEFKKSHQNGLIAILLSSNHLASINGSATAIAKIISENSPVATRQTKQNYNNQHSEIGPIENKIFAHPDNSKVIFESILALIRSGNIKSAKGLATGSYILFGKDVKVFNLFLRQYAESNDIVAIRNLMTEMSALKIPPDIYTWNTILSFYWKNKRPLSAKTLFALIIHYSEIDTQKSNNHTQPSFSILATDSLLDHWRKMLGARNIDKYIENLLNEWINDQDVRHLWTPNRATIAIMLKGLADKNTKDEIIHLTKVLRERDTLKTKILTGRHERLLINRLSFHDTNGDSPSTPISRNLMNQASQLYGPLHDLLKTSQNHHVAKKDMIDRRSEWHTALRNLIKNHSTHKEGIDDQTHDILAIIHTALDAMRCEGTWPTHATYVLLLNNLINIDDYTSAFALVETMIATDKLLLDNWTITAIIKGLSQQGPLALELLGNVASQNALDSTITPSHQMLLATLKTNALQNSLKKVCNTVEILAEKFGIYPNDESYRLIIDASLASNQKALVEKMLWNLEKQRLGLLV